MRREGDSGRSRAWLVAESCRPALACGSAGGGGPEAATAAAAAQTAPAAPEEPAAKTDSNVVKWKAASEVNNVGYDVVRGESPDGPFFRINAEVIEGAGATDEPTAYRYVDRTIDPHKTHYCYVQSVSMDGVRERFTPIGKAEPRLTGAAEEPDAKGGDPERGGSD